MRKILFLFLVLMSTMAHAETKPVHASEPLSKGFMPFDLSLPKAPERHRATFWPQFACVFLPGFDQWWEGQDQSGIFYSGTAVLGLDIALNASRSIDKNTSTSLDSRDNRVRQATLGLQLYQDSGFLSAYHSFRSAVRTRQTDGEFQFLKHEENGADLLLAPLHFSFLTEPSTFIPLGIFAGISTFYLSSGNSNRARNFTISDSFYASAFSYGAGVTEEAAFRGWLMPEFMNSWQSEFWSNTATAVIFGAAHLSGDNPIPWPQFALGWYLGWLAQKNDWRISQGIFVHAWWDVIAFTAAYLDDPGSSKNRVLFLPLVDAHF